MAKVEWETNFLQSWTNIDSEIWIITILKEIEEEIERILQKIKIHLTISILKFHIQKKAQKKPPSDGIVQIQLFTKCYSQTLVFMWNSAWQEEYNLCFSGDFG